MNSTQQKIHAILFWKNEPMTLSEISALLKISKEEVLKELQNIKEALLDTGVVLMQNEEEYSLATAPSASEMIGALEKAELSRELSKSALETLSIVLYKGPLRRSEIDYIRGVNSQFILRHLEIRGLVEKEQSKEDARVFLYKPTLDLLGHLGVTNKTDLPEYESLYQALKIQEEESNEESQTSKEVE